MDEAPPLERSIGRAPRQSRSRATLMRVAEAAAELFGEHGYEGATISDIVQRAGCSVGAFYARFNDKDALFRHVHDRHCQKLVERVDFVCDLLKAENAPLDAAVRQAIRALFQFGGGRRDLTRVFIERSGTDPAFHLRYAHAWAEVRERLRAAFLARRRQIGHRDPEHAVDVVLQLIHASWANDVLHHRVSEVAGMSSGDVMIDDVIDVCLVYLKSGGNGRR